MANFIMSTRQGSGRIYAWDISYRGQPYSRVATFHVSQDMHGEPPPLAAKLYEALEAGEVYLCEGAKGRVSEERRYPIEWAGETLCGRKLPYSDCADDMYCAGKINHQGDCGEQVIYKKAITSPKMDQRHATAAAICRLFGVVEGKHGSGQRTFDAVVEELKRNGY